MTETTKTFEFDVTLDDLLYVNGAGGLNEVLDFRMGNDPEFEGIIATDISYEAVLLSPGDTALITIRATFTPDPMFGEDED